MQKWKCAAIILIMLNALFAACLIDDYYEVFIKDCRDMFPFSYCLWGAESLGSAWRTADAYWNSSVIYIGVFSICLLAGIYALYQKRYAWALCLSIIPWFVLKMYSVVCVG